MVILTITDSMIAAIEYCSSRELRRWPLEAHDGDVSLEEPSVGKPISHRQVIELYKCLRDHAGFRGGKATASEKQDTRMASLDKLLRGSTVYIEPAKRKREPTPEYKALMAQLRREEEAMVYERMVTPSLPFQSSNDRFQSPLETRSAHSKAWDEEEEVTFADINRQMALIINVLLSIIACSVAIWMAASHWSTPKRLGLSMSGSGIVGIAEIAIYAGYLRRVKESKQREKRKVEVKEVIETWVIEKADEAAAHEVEIKEPLAEGLDHLRRRHGNVKT